MGKTQPETKKSADFEDLKAWLDTRFSKQESKLEELKESFASLEGEIGSTRDECEELRAENSALKNEVQDLKWRLQQQEAYQRKDNLRFFNIPERAGENTERELRRFMEREMNIDTDRIEFSTVHRVGRITQQPKQSRCIIARFVRRNDVQRVKGAASNLRGTHYGVSEDLPAEWVATRRRAHQKFVKPAREQNKRVRWRGDELFIDGKKVDLHADNGRSGLRPDSASNITAATPDNINRTESETTIIADSEPEDSETDEERETPEEEPVGSTSTAEHKKTAKAKTSSPPLPQRKSQRLTRLERFGFKKSTTAT